MQQISPQDLVQRYLDLHKVSGSRACSVTDNHQYVILFVTYSHPGVATTERGRPQSQAQGLQANWHGLLHGDAPARAVAQDQQGVFDAIGHDESGRKRRRGLGARARTSWSRRLWPALHICTMLGFATKITHCMRQENILQSDQYSRVHVLVKAIKAWHIDTIPRADFVGWAGEGAAVEKEAQRADTRHSTLHPGGW